MRGLGAATGIALAFGAGGAAGALSAGLEGVGVGGGAGCFIGVIATNCVSGAGGAD